METLLIVVGFAIGVLMGLTGIGGAVYTTPILIFLGIPPMEAVGSDVAFLMVAKSWGAFLHIRKGNVDYSIFKFLILGSILSIAVACLILTYITVSNEFFNKFLIFLLGLLLIGIGFQYLYNTLGRKGGEKKHHGEVRFKKLGGFLVGAFVSLIINFTSIGGGSMLMPYLMRVMGDPRLMVGTSLLFSFVAVTVASILHAGLGNVNPWISLPLILGSLPGTYIGTILTINIRRSTLLIFIATSLVAIGAIMLSRIILFPPY